MLEQGTHEEDLHRQVGAYAAESAADILIAVGRASEKMAEEASARGMRDVRWCPDHESAMAELEQLAKRAVACIWRNFTPIRRRCWKARTAEEAETNCFHDECMQN